MSSIEEMKEGLAQQTGYLILQLSDDRQHLYYGMLYITKERKYNYYVSKVTFSDFMREKLGEMIDKLAQAKISMQKTPITCLLYTSPSPRDRQKSRMPSSA